MKRSTRSGRPAAEQEAARCAGTAWADKPGEDDMVLAKILALIRTLPFGGEDEWPEGGSEGSSARDAWAAGDSRVPRIGSSSKSEQAACVCANLIAAAEAFAGFSDEDLFAVPEETRDGARGALIGVWKTLDLLKRLEATRGQLVAEC